MIKVIVTGAEGQLGWELRRTSPEGVELLALNQLGLDITNENQVYHILSKEKPDWVINAAAYTAVDKAENDESMAYLVNAKGPENLAKVCRKIGTRLLQVSTDFVFDGKKSSPYLTGAKPNPLSVYGASKQAGDDAVLKELGSDSVVVRTSWVYSSHGNNFVKTMIRLMSEKPELSIVADQIGTPTWANGLAEAIWSMLDKDLSHIVHWTDYGVASWYDFAVAIYDESISLGLLSKGCHIIPIRTDQYSLPATRPQYSVMDKSDTVMQLEIEPEHWRVALRKMLKELNDQD